MKHRSILSLVVVMFVTVALLSAAGYLFSAPARIVEDGSTHGDMSQSPNSNVGGKRMVDLRADDAYYISKGDSTIFILVGNFAAHHNGAVIMADSAVRYSNQSFECFGNVLINQNDTYVYGNRAEYNNQTATATVYSDLVKIVDGEAVMYTYNCTYNTSSEIGEFSGGCFVEKGSSLMESERGIYNTKTHDLTAIERVEMRDDTYQMRGDSVIFNTQTENARYFMHSNIWNDKDEYLYTDAGSYDKERDLHHLTRNAYILSPEREIWSDTIEYYRSEGHIIGRRNIQLDDIEQNILSFADYGEWWDEPGNALFTGRPSMINYDAEQRDSVYISADTLWLYTIPVLPPETNISSDSVSMNTAVDTIPESEVVADVDDEAKDKRQERQERREERQEERKERQEERQERREERKEERDTKRQQRNELSADMVDKSVEDLVETPVDETVAPEPEPLVDEAVAPEFESLVDETVASEPETPVKDVEQPEQPVERPVERPVEQPVERPVEQPVEQPAERPAEEAIAPELETPVKDVEQPEQPAERPAEQPTEQPVEQPAEEAIVPVPETPVKDVEQPEQPAEQPVEQPIEQPVEQPFEQPFEQPAEELDVPESAGGDDSTSHVVTEYRQPEFRNDVLGTMTLDELAKRQSYLSGTVEEMMASRKSASDSVVVKEEKPLTPKELRRRNKNKERGIRDSIKSQRRYISDSIRNMARIERDSLARIERIERDSLKAVEQSVKDSLYKLKYGERDSLLLIERMERDSLRKMETDSLIAKRRERSSRLADEEKERMERISKSVQEYQRKRIERAKARAARRGKEYKGPEFEDLFPDAMAADSLATDSLGEGAGHDHDHGHDHGHDHDHDHGHDYGDMASGNSDSLAMGTDGRDSLMTNTDSLAVAKPFPADSAYKMVKAYRNVRLYRSDSQMICDSLVTFNTDSIVRLYKDPVLWNESNQITSDSMLIYTRSQKIDKAHFMGSPLMIGEIDTMYYNQVKGKDMTAMFADGKVCRNDVNGNAQTIYFMQEEDNPEVTGLMYIESANISFYFDDGEINQIVYKQNPEYVLYPMDMIPETQERRLPDFAWHGDRRPTRDSVIVRNIRPSQRDDGDSRTKPTFRITERINYDRRRLTENNMWIDRVDVLPPDIIEWRNSRASYKQRNKQ